MYPITRIPVVILSSKRTGSTALAADIRDQLRETHGNLRFYGEPMESASSKPLEDLMASIELHEPFILKVHAHDMVRQYPQRVNDLARSGECCLVRIRRRNTIEQVASHYLASKSNTWQHHAGDPYEVTEIHEVDMEWLDRSIRYINHYNMVLDSYPARFDLDLFYEDLGFSGNIYVKTPRPTNYHLLLQAVEDRLRRR
jgi:LPS sulfotransferase NodH